MILEHRFIKEAKGAYLADAVGLRDGQALSRGAYLGPEEIAALTMSGIQKIRVAELDTHDIAADIVLRQIVAALVPHFGDACLDLHMEEPGLAELRATRAGVLGIDTAGVISMNAIDEGVSVVTLPQFRRVCPGQPVARIRILPLAIQRSTVSRILEDVADMIRVRPVLAETASVILTSSRGENGVVGCVESISRKLATLGISVTETVKVPHETDALAEALVSLSGDMILILPAQQTQDRSDILPRAIIEAGGVITRFGLPVEPGARMIAGGLGAAPILGLPVASHAPHMRGVDWVLERLVCGVSISDSDLAELSVGGLLLDVETGS